MTKTNMHRAIIKFQNELVTLLARDARRGEVCYEFDRKASIKDVVEALGVPHTEISRLVVNGEERDFASILKDGDRVAVWPVTGPEVFLEPSMLHPQPLKTIRFLVDVNVGKLARLLRLLGFDAASRPALPDQALAELAQEEQRILLTRDANLLKRRNVEFGRLIRSNDPREQLLEVLGIFGLIEKFRPFSRCLCCNTPLQSVTKEEILHRLLPLTKKYYDSFCQCPGCDRIYWPGSHQERMQDLLAGIKGMLPVATAPPG